MVVHGMAHPLSAFPENLKGLREFPRQAKGNFKAIGGKVKQFAVDDLPRLAMTLIDASDLPANC
jgi:hypothetical protein